MNLERGGLDGCTGVVFDVIMIFDDDDVVFFFFLNKGSSGLNLDGMVCHDLRGDVVVGGIMRRAVFVIGTRWRWVVSVVMVVVGSVRSYCVWLGDIDHSAGSEQDMMGLMGTDLCRTLGHIE